MAAGAGQEQRRAKTRALPLRVLNLGKTGYHEVRELQKKLQRGLIEGTESETLIACEHPPVITRGKTAGENEILAGEDLLKKSGIEIVAVERGGKSTYHGPGQIVLYPILNLNNHKRDVGWYMRSLEETVIALLNEYEITGERIEGRTGVWIRKSDPSGRDRKIASIGVRISRWCTMHGLSLNVNDCREGFSLINPCGYSDIEITSLEQEGKRAFDIVSVTDSLVVKFCGVFGYNN